ncbi:hypothetical protein BA896_021860 [Janthinobacterium lividum]|uniref:Uncharacterized protein n=1 Tax=Janthinobacterium lividum TaxID=29581 RepID=A0A1E8PJA5_9BURK|nr:hypothetical protein BA896_021860 [Janthinobacterium lividum]
MSQQKALDDQAAALALQQKELDGRAIIIAGQEAVIKKAAHADFAEALCTDGKLLPTQKAGVIEIMSQLDAANQVADFAADDANHGKTGADLFKAFLSAQPKQVVFGRISQEPGADGGVADFAAPPGTMVDPAGMETYRKAVAYQLANPGTDLISAAKAVSR